IALLEVFGQTQVDGDCGGKVTERCIVGTLVAIEPHDEFWNQKMEISKALSMAVAHHVDGNAVDEKRNIGAVIGVEATQEVLVGFPASRVLDGEEPGDCLDDIGGPEPRTKLELARSGVDL